MKKTLISLGSLSISLALPVLALAQTFKTGYINSIINGGLRILSILIVLLISLATVWFIWNVIKYSMSSEEDDKAKAKSQMINGIIAIAVIVSIWGLVGLLQGMFGVNSIGATTGLENMIPTGN